MSNNNGFELSVKNYAEQRGKTVQAVYQQMKRKENAKALEGHIKIYRVGNKDVKYLDETAIEILDRASSSAPLTVIEDGLKEELQEAKVEIELLKYQLAKEEGKVELLQKQLEEKNKELKESDVALKKVDTLLLSAKNDQDRIQNLEAEQKRLQEALRASQDALKEEQNKRYSFRDWFRNKRK